MRIEQPKHLNARYHESFRLATRLSVVQVLIVVLLPSAAVLGSLAMQSSSGQPVAPWRWVGGASMGLLCLGIVKGCFWLMTAGDRYAEMRGDKLRLGPFGYSFRRSKLLFCRIVPDDHFPEISHLSFCFRLFPFARPRFWSMMVEDLTEAEEFRKALVEGKT